MSQRSPRTRSPPCPFLPQPRPSKPPSCFLSLFLSLFWMFLYVESHVHAIGAFVSAHLFSQGIRFLLCLFVIKFPLFDIEIPDGSHIRCNRRGRFRNYGHNLGAETPVPAGTPQPDPRQETAGSSCGPHRNQGNAESWKTHHNAPKHCSRPKGATCSPLWGQ